MSYNIFSGKDPYGNRFAVQNDRQIYEDFVKAQEELRKNYAGAASKNDISKMIYNNKGFEKFKEINYVPQDNKKNVYERKLNKEVPKTRDRFVKNAFTQLLNPQIENETTLKKRFDHDKLNIKDIEGTGTETYGRYR